MSEDSDKAAEAPPKKSKASMVFALVIALITLIGGSVAGAVLGPRLLGTAESQTSPPAKGGADPQAAKVVLEEIVSVDIAPIVVDLRDADGRLRHLKVGMSAELPKTANLDAFKLLAPRGREASLSYLRSLTFEEVSDPKRYLTIKEELSRGFSEAVGAERVNRVLLIDFVLQ